MTGIEQGGACMRIVVEKPMLCAITANLKERSVPSRSKVEQGAILIENDRVKAGSERV